MSSIYTVSLLSALHYQLVLFDSSGLQVEFRELQFDTISPLGQRQKLVLFICRQP